MGDRSTPTAPAESLLPSLWRPGRGTRLPFSALSVLGLGKGVHSALRGQRLKESLSLGQGTADSGAFLGLGAPCVLSSLSAY